MPEDLMAKNLKLADDQFPPYCLSGRRRYLDLIIKSPDGYPRKGYDPRTLFDSWYAHWKGPPYVKSTGTVQWFNYREMALPRLREAVKSMHYVSKDAWDVLIEKVAAQRLMKDHAVPVKVLRREIKAKSFATVEQLERFLIDRYRVGVITKTEDDRLPKDLRADMPDGDHSEYARYNDPRVEIERSIEHVEWLRNRTETWKPLPLIS
jgi:hypothetical protein